MIESPFLHAAQWCYRRRWIGVGYTFQRVYDYIHSWRFRRLLRRRGYGRMRH